MTPKLDGQNFDWENLHTENTEFQEYRTEVQVLNTTAIASDYAGHDPQGRTSDKSFL